MQVFGSTYRVSLFQALLGVVLGTLIIKNQKYLNDQVPKGMVPKR